MAVCQVGCEGSRTQVSEQSNPGDSSALIPFASPDLRSRFEFCDKSHLEPGFWVNKLRDSVREDLSESVQKRLLAPFHYEENKLDRRSYPRFSEARPHSHQSCIGRRFQLNKLARQPFLPARLRPAS